MRTRLFHIWDTLISSYWFVPSLMMTLAVALAFALIAVDEGMQQREGWWLTSVSVDGVRGILSTIAGSIITVAGVVFSITIVAMTQASAQFGPRILRNFMDDTGNQVVLGTFISTFLYCLVVLRSVRGSEASLPFVPHVSVAVAVVLAIVSMCVLIYFIHHVSRSIQAPHVVAKVASELEGALRRSYPTGAKENKGSGGQGNLGVQLPDAAEAAMIRSHASGYVQVVDVETIMGLAIERDLCVQLLLRPGRFAIDSAPLARAWPRNRIDNDLAERIAATFIIGHDRTAEQDVEFIIDQIAEIALRALSPGVNDPFTAMNCIEWLGVVLVRVAGENDGTPHMFDCKGHHRVTAKVPTFEAMVDEAMRQIRQSAYDKPAVVIHMLDVIALMLQTIDKEQHCRALWRNAELIVAHSRRSSMLDSDRADIDDRLRIIEQTVEPSSPRNARSA